MKIPSFRRQQIWYMFLFLYLVLFVKTTEGRKKKRKRKNRDGEGSTSSRRTTADEVCEACVPDSSCDCMEQLNSNYLTKTEDFPTRSNYPKVVQGMHIGCACPCSTDSSLAVFTFARHAMEESPRLSFTISKDASFRYFRETVDRVLEIPENPGRYGRPELRQPWRMFDPFLRQPLTSVSDALRSRSPGFKHAVPVQGMVYVIEGGQFIHNGLRVGAVQDVTLDDETVISLTTRSLRPLLFETDFLSEDECTHIVDVMRDRMGELHNSGVIQNDHDQGKKATEWRTSSQMWLKKGHSATTKALANRAADFTGTEYNQQADTQLLRYLDTQFYDAHLDAFDPAHYQLYIDSIDHGHKNRLLTIFWYLTDVPAGGETIFPRAYGLPQPHNFHDCDNSKGLKVRPRRGNIILWYNLLPNGVVDQDALHGGCPVKENGTKLSANVWIWNKAKY